MNDPDTKSKERQLALFWGRRFFDFNVWSLTKKNEKLGYMHANPVKRELVVHPKDWPWSSYSFYAREGVCLIAMDTVPRR